MVNEGFSTSLTLNVTYMLVPVNATNVTKKLKRSHLGSIGSAVVVGERTNAALPYNYGKNQRGLV
jgi:hypothetical protein